MSWHNLWGIASGGYFMAKTPPPVVVEKTDCGNGKRKIVVREREYDVLSWQGAKTIVSVLMAVGAAIVAVLTAYYSAEASQNERIAIQAQAITKVEQRHDSREKAVDNVLTKLDKTLTEQQVLIRDNGNRLIEVQTTQKMMGEKLKEVAEDVKKLNKP